MTAQHRTFFESLPFVVVATVDRGGPVATILSGAPGFVSAPDGRTLRITAPLAPSDPATRSLRPGAPAGLLGIELATRRRTRANGIIESADENGLVLGVRQSFGNCPQYIHPREAWPAPATPSDAEPLDRLDPEARRMIARADTFFVASSARTDQAQGGVDVSHRGGPPGFVRLDGDRLTIPDYSGNRYFNTLGNLVADPRAALLLVDFKTGDLLHLQGTTEIIWDGPEVAAFPGAERLWRLQVQRAWRRRSALPLRFSQA